MHKVFMLKLDYTEQRVIERAVPSLGVAYGGEELDRVRRRLRHMTKDAFNADHAQEAREALKVLLDTCDRQSEVSYWDAALTPPEPAKLSEDADPNVSKGALYPPGSGRAVPIVLSKEFACKTLAEARGQQYDDFLAALGIVDEALGLFHEMEVAHV